MTQKKEMMILSTIIYWMKDDQDEEEDLTEWNQDIDNQTPKWMKLNYEDHAANHISNEVNEIGSPADKFHLLYDPIDYFCELFSDNVFTLILEETNRYADQYCEENFDYLQIHPRASFFRTKKNSTTSRFIEIDDVKEFIGVIILMSISNTKNLEDHWSKHYDACDITHTIV